MEPTAQLEQEHEAITLMLDILESVCARIESGKKVEQGHLNQILDFAQVFVDKCHHRKEEEVLFPAMVESDIYKEGGINDHIKDHETGRQYVKTMKDALVRYNKGNQKALSGFAKTAGKYITLFRGHIDSENNILFPAADAHIPAGKKKELMKNFETIEKEKIGAGGHARFHKTLESLKKIYLM